MTARERWREIFYDTSTEWSELWSSLLALAWAVTLLNPWADVWGSNPTYSTMRWFAPAQWEWGVVFLFLFVVQAGGLFRVRETWRRRGAFFSTSLWLFMVLMFLASGALLGGTLYAVHAFSCARIYLVRSRSHDRGK